MQDIKTFVTQCLLPGRSTRYLHMQLSIVNTFNLVGCLADLSFIIICSIIVVECKTLIFFKFMIFFLFFSSSIKACKFVHSRLMFIMWVMFLGPIAPSFFPSCKFLISRLLRQFSNRKYIISWNHVKRILFNGKKRAIASILQG